MTEPPQRGCATGQIANFGWDRVKLGRAEQQADPRSIDPSTWDRQWELSTVQRRCPNYHPGSSPLQKTSRRRFAEELESCETMGRDISALRVPAKAETTPVSRLDLPDRGALRATSAE